MQIPMYQIDAFADRLFTGNPAAVVFTDDELPSWLMQSIAAENNLAETAFVWLHGDTHSIRWFTPEIEVDLCGHATLAAAHAIFTYRDSNAESLSFSSKSGTLNVFQGEGMLWLDFPSDKLHDAIELQSEVQDALQCTVQRVLKGRHDLVAVLDSEALVASLRPNLSLIRQFECRGVIVTAVGNDVDFVSRFFAPQSGIDEDPVTGSAHTSLTPYWSGALGRNDLVARQLSKRGGVLHCRMQGDRIHIGGKSVTYMQGHITIDPG